MISLNFRCILMSYEIFLHIEFLWWIIVVICLIVDPNEGFGINPLRILYLIVGGDNLIIRHDYMIFFLLISYYYVEPCPKFK